jgi:hypothetical protein
LFPHKELVPLIDSTLLGQTTAQLMDAIEARPPVDGDGSPLEGVEMVAVGIVVICSNHDYTFTRTFCSDTRTYQQVGLFTEALDCARAAPKE